MEETLQEYSDAGAKVGNQLQINSVCASENIPELSETDHHTGMST